MDNYDIHLKKLDELCELLDKEGVTGNIIDRLNPCGEPSVSIWNGPYARHLEKGFNSSDILFKVYWFPIQKTYCLLVKNEKYDNIMKKFYQPDISNHYIFTTPQLIVTTIKMLFSNEENTNMNKDQKREEASLIHELTIRKIEWKSLGVIQGHPTIRIYNNGPIADIHVLATNKDYLTSHGVSESKDRGYDNGDRIKDVIFNDPATIVFWNDGTKTVVQAVNEPFDPEKGLAMAICRKAFGNKHDYYDVFKKYVGRYEKKQKGV